jgi:hypothetical protein
MSFSPVEFTLGIYGKNASPPKREYPQPAGKPNAAYYKKSTMTKGTYGKYPAIGHRKRAIPTPAPPLAG